MEAEDSFHSPFVERRWGEMPLRNPFWVGWGGFLYFNAQEDGDDALSYANRLLRRRTAYVHVVWECRCNPLFFFFFWLVKRGKLGHQTLRKCLQAFCIYVQIETPSLHKRRGICIYIFFLGSFMQIVVQHQSTMFVWECCLLYFDFILRGGGGLCV